jgi:O-antigen/teichoic acid export membrane protein
VKIPYKETLGIIQLLAIRGGGMLALFLVNVIIARTQGAVAQGLFQIGLAWVMVAATVARFGQDPLMLRTAAEFRAIDDLPSAHRSLNASLGLVTLSLVVATCSAMLLMTFGPLKAQNEESLYFLFVMATAIPPMGILMVITETQRGWLQINLAMAWQSSIPQCLLFLMVAGGVLLGLKSHIWVAFAYVAAFALAAVFAFRSWLNTSQQPIVWPPIKDMKSVFYGGSNFWVFAVLTAIIAWLDVILLGYVADAETVGRYTAVVRTGAVLGTLVQIISAGAVARLAVLYAKGDFAGFAKYFRTYFQLFFAAAIPLAVSLYLFPTEIMSIWGAAYANSETLILVYGGFQVLNFFLCLTGFCVAVIGLEKQLVTVQFISLAFKVILIFAGFRIAGLQGALWGAGLSLFIFNILSSVIFFQRLKQNGLSFRSLLG